MASVIVCGGSVIGLSAAMFLARDGHEVTVLERDPSPPSPAALAWDGWRRSGVAQFQQAHVMLPPVRQVLEAELPGMTARLTGAGCTWQDPVAVVPPTLTDWQRQPEDDATALVTGRRPVVEAVLAAAAEEEPGVTVRRGTGVAGLLAGPPARPGVPHVTGVRTSAGQELRADLVVDATGRQTKLARWLADIGGQPPYLESEDSGFVYYTRYFAGPQRPVQRGPIAAPYGTFSVLTLPGDNGTWSVTIWTASADKALRPLRDTGRFMAVAGACPLQAHWLDGEPITGVLVMAGILDQYRRFVVGGQPVATGVLAVGDSWACTNPSAGRGISVGLKHAQRLRDVVRAAGGDPVALARDWDRATEQDVTPFYRGQIVADQIRLAEMAALREGRDPAPADPVTAGWAAGAMQDSALFRGLLDLTLCLDSREQVLARPGFRERAASFAGAPPMALPGPDRAQLLALAGS
jgi:2-polyprenyl-6-methoxyphenol hydroxylase-like FAD-dependent oxidoreductase